MRSDATRNETDVAVVLPVVLREQIQLRLGEKTRAKICHTRHSHSTAYPSATPRKQRPCATSWPIDLAAYAANQLTGWVVQRCSVTRDPARALCSNGSGVAQAVRRHKRPMDAAP